MSDVNVKKLPVNPNLVVKGFNPEEYVQEYTNSNGEKLSRLPFNAQLMWFRMKYPNGKIAVETRPGKNVIISKARVYAERTDPVDAFIAEGESSRGPSPDMPGVNPRNWSQTAAIATALRYAGFGLECDLAGEAPETVSGEWDELMDNPPKFTTPASKNSIENIVEGDEGVQDSLEGFNAPPAPSEGPDYENMTDEEACAAAGNVVVDKGKYKGKNMTLNMVLSENPTYANFVLNRFEKTDPIYKAVKVLADAAMRLAD